MKIDIDWLEQQIIKSPLSETQKMQWADTMQTVTVAKGESIVREGEKGGTLYLVRSGSVDIFQQMDAKEQHLGTLGEGALIGEITFLSDEAATASATAKEESVLYRIKRTDFTKLIQPSADMVFSLFTYMLLYQSKMVHQCNEDQVKMMSFMTGAHK
ncbi:cyclic nucleotide-binding domain-containing protein [Mariprofundus sp. EBB-1]|uniref:cyclic nucleotide-binding domain-containing protein n=1 Tax=Mariprofundus sp. EBB-1 TaxID=2650971 RepID=UPI000EF18DD9|nr:cyclic nucleotide-binding domain-containing protein [Mariprofundus sp. EBB-1]RLL51931.1 cyclic nucleotide-binding domain-containing protein [Mariprofundus sp. EBB-1]